MGKLARQVIGRAKTYAVECLRTPDRAWRVAGFAIFLTGLAIGLHLEGAAIGITLACFIVLSPLLVLAGLLYEFQSNPEPILPSFKTLLILMFLCWTALEIFALGALAFRWSNAIRVVLLLIMSGTIAWLIFSYLVKARSPAPPAA
jgi:hypothetical protein